jgi:FtsZ-interacting cell division protein YlmF
MKTTAQKRKESREARAADPYAYQRSQEAKERKKPKKKPKELPAILQDSANGAVARMKLYIQQWPGQMDHDRDIVLLDIHRMLRQLTTP